VKRIQKRKSYTPKSKMAMMWEIWLLWRERRT
jgi:hypothetical protein